MELLRQYQLDIMLVMIGICGITVFFVYFTGALSRKRKLTLMALESFATILLCSDRLAYLYRGDLSRTGYWMVRISNFLVFLMTLEVVLMLNIYISDLMTKEGGHKYPPFALRICEIIITVGVVLLVISQFTGLYYTFDDSNHYVRSPGFLLSYIPPLSVMLIQFGVIIANGSCLRKMIRYPLIFFAVVPVIASVVQYFTYGVSLINMSIVGMAVVLYTFVLVDINSTVSQTHKLEIDYLRRQQKSMHRLFEQTATALASAIDAKDKYTHGHSSRVAEYSKRIAELAGKSEEECEEIYFSALLHDVGKIGIPDYIINKDGRLSDEEYEAIKQHPIIGRNILSSINEYPYLSIAAHHHHERYDGRGYPDKLKGEDIPDIARIVAVADAYDAMTSKRSYRDSIPQSKVREEIIKGAGSQFDPVFANIMQHLIDLDTQYDLRERSEITRFAGKEELEIGEYRSTISEGIHVTANKMKVKMVYSPKDEDAPGKSMAALVLFDSNDGHVYSDERKQKELHYFEYGEIFFDGKTLVSGARKMEVSIEQDKENQDESSRNRRNAADYTIEAVRFKDHALIKISGERKTVEVTVALPDSSRYLYLGITGQFCNIGGLKIEKSEETIGKDYIKRIADEISFINVPEGDIPNVQIDTYRADATEGIPITDGLEISFHSMSLPTANLIWHGPYISIFHSGDKRIFGPGYREFALIRIDGENWETDNAGKSEMFVNRRDDFEGWENWKKRNKEGIDCVVRFMRKGNTITTITENMGIYVKNVTTITDDTTDIYAGLTGDQCALTNIRIKA